MNFKRFNGSTWNAIRHKTYDTLTEALDRTENLYDGSYGYMDMYPSGDSMEILASSGGSYSVVAEVEPNTSYTISYTKNGIESSNVCAVGMTSTLPEVGGALLAFDNSTSSESGRKRNWFTTPPNCHYIIVHFYQSTNPNVDEIKAKVKSMMLVESSSSEFVPYGFRLQASGEPLTDYTIYGNTGGVGERTKNLFDKNNADITHLYPVVASNSLVLGSDITWSIIMPCEPNTTYTKSARKLSGQWRSRVAGTASYPTENAACTFVDDNAESFEDDWTQNIFTTTADTHWLICWMVYHGTEQFLLDLLDTLQVEVSNGRTSYEPYGYKIPVSSGGVTTNLYLDAPLDTGDALTYTDTGIALPTVDGDNTITFGTSVQPSAMSATFKGWHPVQAAKTYDGNDWS